MKHFLILLASAIAIACHGQADWTSLFQADPTLADGYFIVDLQKSNTSGVSQVEVDIIASELQHDGSTDVRILETLNIDLSEGFYARLDFDKWSELMDPYRVLYHARGLSPGGDIVIDVEETGDGGSLWPEACRETCVSMLYAYTLVAYSNNSLATIDLHEGTIGGNLTYVYVKASNWGPFKAQFSPSFFGIGVAYWSTLEGYAFGGVEPYATELKRFQYPFQPGHAPPSDARDYQGNLIGHVTETVYAVKRGKGPWQGLVTPTIPFAAQGLYGCGDGQNVLRARYNADPDVQFALSALEMDPLACQGWLIWGQPTTWGSLYHQFRRRIINIVVNGISSDPIPEITSAILESAERPMEDGTIGTPYTLSDVSNVVVSQWNGTSTSEIFAVTVENIGDPRLWPITRTAAPPGLYQFTVILKDGGIITEFMEFNDVTILRADFASFTGVNIYPVPVTDSRFAIDIDLGLPTSINLTVVNNMGHQFHSKVLDYDLPGEHKHVVSMTSQWPNGIYHAIFQFPDGSSSSVSFTVSDQ